MPEQEFQPPRRLARPYRPDRDDDEPPPWANLPPVRPARSGHPDGPAAPFDPAIHSDLNSDSGDFSRSGSHRVADPVQDEPVPQWAQRDVPEDDAGEAAPLPRTREPGGRALRAAARRRRRWYYLGGGAIVVVGAVLAVIVLTGGQPGPASVTPGALITTFQPGELRQVPNACRVVPPATVAQYLPGTPKV
ncbi:MAG TPA: hypothetical protein VGD83_26355, partial [Streptosporangiaceae bacterium]